MDIKVGQHGTFHCGSDRYPIEVVKVVNTKKVVVRSLAYETIRGQGLTETPGEYRFFSDPNGGTQVVSLRKNGRWVRQGDPMRNGMGFSFRGASLYRDPSF